VKNTLDTMILDSFSRLCKNEIDALAQQRLEDGTFERALWDKVESLGLPELLTDYEGELEAPQRTAHAIAMLAGYHALPLPLTEHMIAREALARAGIEAPAGLLAIGTLEGRLSSRIGDQATPAVHGNGVIPWARHADHLVIALRAENEEGIALVSRDARGPAIVAAHNLAAEPRDRVDLRGEPCLRYVPMPGCVEWVALQSARFRAALIAGAAEGALDLTVAYVKDRVQFGKPIGKFQAVQQSLATMAGELTSAHSACSLAFLPRAPNWRSVAVAKMRADALASLGCNVVHQAHGAIGVTSEYPLHLRTRRLWSWRAEAGSGAFWARRLGRAFIDQGPDRLWPSITELRLAEGAESAPSEI